jgi:hypothetical protein
MKKYLVVILTMIAFTIQAQELKRHHNLRGDWKFSIGDHKEWASPTYDDGDWEEIYVPRRWEREGFNGYDGYAWYRLKVDGKEFLKDRVHFLSLGYIDDVDQVYFNGELIGFSGGFPPDYYTAWQAERKYRIPNELIDQNGENLIAVRVFDKGGEGGIYSGDVGLLVAEDGYQEVINLEGLWKLKLRDRKEFIDPDYDDEDWEDIMVPANWKVKGIFNYRDFAWYRKEVIIPEDTNLDDLVFIGGYIDDFDETFLNGEKIGETYDGRRMGQSRSFSELRVYEIPNGLLKPGRNVISIRVEDIGDNGGIYKGPVAIIPEKLVTTYTRDSYWR